MTSNDGGDLVHLRTELNAIVLDTARELIKRDPDRAVIAALDARAEVLREQVRELTPVDADHGIVYRW